MKVLIFLFSLLSHDAFSKSQIKFIAKTDGPGISVEGEVKNLKEHVNFNKLEETSLSLDVMDLFTGMETRDNHMHKKVFGAEKMGQVKIEYFLNKLNCPDSKSEEVMCDADGFLSVKGIKNDLKMKVMVNRKNKTVNGNTIISLNAFKLPAPSFMGITVEDNVDIQFKVSAE